jgi:hypothetical protein
METEALPTPFYERLVTKNPNLAVRYMAHLSRQVLDTATPGSVKNQSVQAHVESNQADLVKAEIRNQDLRNKFLALLSTFQEVHIFIGNRGSYGDQRDIMDLVYDIQGHL